MVDPACSRAACLSSAPVITLLSARLCLCLVLSEFQISGLLRVELFTLGNYSVGHFLASTFCYKTIYPFFLKPFIKLIQFYRSSTPLMSAGAASGSCFDHDSLIPWKLLWDSLLELLLRVSALSLLGHRPDGWDTDNHKGLLASFPHHIQRLQSGMDSLKSHLGSVGDVRSWSSVLCPYDLPQHWPYDCVIDLLPGTPPIKGHLYSLSASRKWQHKLILPNLWLQASFVPHPLLSSFFFFVEMIKSLRPCIDHRGLNYIKIKNR